MKCKKITQGSYTTRRIADILPAKCQIQQKRKEKKEKERELGRNQKEEAIRPKMIKDGLRWKTIPA